MEGNGALNVAFSSTYQGKIWGSKSLIGDNDNANVLHQHDCSGWTIGFHNAAQHFASLEPPSSSIHSQPLNSSCLLITMCQWFPELDHHDN